jgi:hypothetical protein
MGCSALTPSSTTLAPSTPPAWSTAAASPAPSSMTSARGRFGVAEGVICKGGDGRRGDLWMVKIKTDAYLARLRQAFHDDWEAHWE